MSCKVNPEDYQRYAEHNAQNSEQAEYVLSVSGVVGVDSLGQSEHIAEQHIRQGGPEYQKIRPEYYLSDSLRGSGFKQQNSNPFMNTNSIKHQRVINTEDKIFGKIRSLLKPGSG